MVAFRPWRAAPSPQQGPRWFIDAAQYKSLYGVRLCSDLGYRLWEAPPWVRSQLAAKRYGRSDQVGAVPAFEGLDVVSDNLATRRQSQARAPLRAQQCILWCIHHTLRAMHDFHRSYDPRWLRRYVVHTFKLGTTENSAHQQMLLPL